MPRRDRPLPDEVAEDHDAQVEGGPVEYSRWLSARDTLGPEAEPPHQEEQHNASERVEQDTAPSEHPGRHPRSRFDGPAAEARKKETALGRRYDWEEERDENRRIGVLVHEVTREKTQ